MATGAELTYNVNATALQMANAIFGDGVTVTGATYSGATNSSAIYSNGNLAPGVVPGNSGVILSTGNAADFTQSSGDPNRSTGTSTDTTGQNGNAQFNAIARAQTFDASFMDITFVPTGNVMTMQFVLSSEEYPEYANATFNDVVGVWVNGNFVSMSVGNGVAGVTNVNGITQPNLFVSNTGDQFNTEMDGFTLTLSLTIPVNPGVTNSIRIGVADTGDAAFDTNLLIAADSLQTVLVARDESVTMTRSESETINVLANDSTTAGTLVITHINGQAVVAGQTITLPTGQQVTLNADGTFTIVGDGQTESPSFTYTVTNGVGQTDVGIVTITQAPCFTVGTLIRTPAGEVPVEDLQPGDLVDTLDDGPQPLRWIGQRTVPAIGPMAPIRIRAGTFGAHGTLLMSPQHRVLVRDALAQLLFGEDEVLVAAQDLVNDRSVRRIEGGAVTYVHLLFDRHQVIWSAGLATESYLPGPMSHLHMDAPVMQELCALFPELHGPRCPPAARRTLRRHETRVLFAA